MGTEKQPFLAGREIAKRLNTIIEERFSNNVSALARKCSEIDPAAGRYRQRIQNYLSRESMPGLDAAAVIAQAANVPIDWLIYGGELGKEEKAEMDRVLIPLAAISVSAGDGADAFDEIADYVSYSRDLLRRETGADPERLFLIPVIGESMKPTLQPGDRLLAEKYADESIRDGAIYILRHRYHGIAVKRLHVRSGGLEIRGDNDSEPVDVTAIGTEESDWSIVARAIHVEKLL